MPLSVQRSAHLGWEDMKGKHVILLGSHKSHSQIPELPVAPKFRVASGVPVQLSHVAHHVLAP